MSTLLSICWNESRREMGTTLHIQHSNGHCQANNVIHLFEKRDLPARALKLITREEKNTLAKEVGS